MRIVLRRDGVAWDITNNGLKNEFYKRSFLALISQGLTFYIHVTLVSVPVKAFALGKVQLKGYLYSQ